MPMPSLAVIGVREGRELSGAGIEDVFVFRSSLRGLCLELPGNDGDEGGSFFTMIFGAFALLPLSRQSSAVLKSKYVGCRTYDLGDLFPSTGDLSFGVVAVGPFAIAIAESVLSMEGAAEVGAKFVYRGLWRSKDGKEPTEAEATAVDMTSTDDCSSREECSVLASFNSSLFDLARKSGRELQSLGRQGGPVERVCRKTSVAGLKPRQRERCNCRQNANAELLAWTR